MAENPNPQPEWLPRLTADMDTELRGHLVSTFDNLHGGRPQGMMMIADEAINAATGLAASYLHRKDDEIRDLKEPATYEEDWADQLRGAIDNAIGESVYVESGFAVKAAFGVAAGFLRGADAEVADVRAKLLAMEAQRDTAEATVAALDDEVIPNLRERNAGLRKAMSKAEITIAARDAELADLHGEAEETPLPEPEPAGAWVAAFHDYSHVAMFLGPDAELRAYRYASPDGMRVRFLPDGGNVPEVFRD